MRSRWPARLAEWLAAGPVTGRLLAARAGQRRRRSSEMDLAGVARSSSRPREIAVRDHAHAVRAGGAPGTFLVSATRLGGLHGYDDAGAVAPLGGAVTGFTKTYKRERPDALVKAVDFAAGVPADPKLPAPDRGNAARSRRGRDRVSQAASAGPSACASSRSPDGQPGLTLDNETVFVITGAAGSIVSAITADLAAASGGTFYLLDVAPEPDPADPDLAAFRHRSRGPEARSLRPHTGARRARHSGAGGKGTGRAGAGARGHDCDRRSAAPRAEPRTTSSVDLTDARRPSRR